MRGSKFFIFFSIVLILYTGINYYILYRGLSVFEEGSPWRTVWMVSILFLAVSFIAGRFLERKMVNPFSAVLIWVGAFWLAFMVYILIQLFLIDFIRLLDHWFRFLPASILTNPFTTKKIAGIAVITISFVFVISGYINTWFPKVKVLEISIHKKAGRLKNLNIVAFSDVHLGTHLD